MIYYVTNENTQEVGRFTSKKAALKSMANINRAGQRYNCYIYDGDCRVDNGVYDAEQKIRGYR